MSKVHNKKRNVGLIYEQVVQHICKNMLDKNENAARQGIKILKKHFREGTQLSKEFKLFKALVTTKNVSSPLASSIINEAKKACNYHFDSDKLEKEKTSLIKDLNVTFGKGEIFKEQVSNYRNYATVQSLLSEWRNPSENFDRLTDFEVNLHNSLTESFKNSDADLELPSSYDKLTFNLMNEIFNKKYSNTLDDSQRNMIKLYTNNDDSKLKSLFESTKKETIDILNNYIDNCNNSIIKNKYKKVYDNIDKLDESNISKDNLKKFLTLSKLKNEILRG